MLGLPFVYISKKELVLVGECGLLTVVNLLSVCTERCV